MRNSANTDWNHSRAVAVALAAPAPSFEGTSMRELIIAIRDTMIVLALQIVFRVSLFLRHLNY
jgi:hypothetical protein